jgi:tetraacyldisaccharide 4'-kinase
MNGTTERYMLGVMSGQQRGVGPTVLRGAMSVAEPFYKAAMSLRNYRYDNGWGVHHLPRPVISVGNITAGGTGKTPVVRWLCERLLELGHHPAVLTRGFRSADEPRMLGSFFGTDAGTPRVAISVNSDRVAAGKQLLADQPEIDVLVMDDGFQHRRLDRDFDMVLVNATQPFGFGHVHPRGLLRESIRGLRRASAVLLTRVDGVSADVVAEIERTIQAIAPGVPVFHCSHQLAGLRRADAPADQPPDADISELAGKRVIVLCGLGDPASFEQQLRLRCGQIVRSIRIGDHRSPTEQQMAELRSTTGLQADAIVTTEKDWQNIDGASFPKAVPVWRVDMRIRFAGDDEQELLSEIQTRLK